MKKNFIALSLLSGIYLASSALAAPGKWLGSSVDTTASLNIMNTVNIGLGATAPKEFASLRFRDEVFQLELMAPGNVKVAIAGKNFPLATGEGVIMQDGVDPKGFILMVGVADKSLLTDDLSYLPDGASTIGIPSAPRVLIVEGSGDGSSKISIPFVSADNYQTPPTGTYSYTFIAQAFVE